MCNGRCFTSLQNPAAQFDRFRSLQCSWLTYVMNFGLEHISTAQWLVGWYVNMDKQEYRRKGRVVGSWYDANGDPTEELRRVEAIAAKAAADQKDKAAAKAEEVVCNTQWSARDGTLPS